MAFGDFLGMLAVARGNGHWIKAGLAVSHQMTIIDNEAAAQNTDPEILPVRQR